MTKPELMVTASPADLRNDYAMRTLDEGDVDRDPLRQLKTWLEEAIRAQVSEPTAMTLATVDARARPACRVVLLKGIDTRGVVFFTNYESRKGKELADNPFAALTVFWKELERQVRIEGTVERVSAEESSAYFATRPLGSRIGAWASPQSETIESRAWLEHRWSELTDRYGAAPPRPPHWGGYRVLPDYLEFWQGRTNRLHDRIAYSAEGKTWRIRRLAP